MNCPKCGSALLEKEASCGICRRNEDWESRNKRQFSQSLFSKRIQKNLQKVGIVPREKDLMEIKEGGGLYLYGAAGSGKTLYASAIMLEVARWGFVYPDFPRIYMELISSINLLEKIRSSFNPSPNRESDALEKTTKEILDHYGSVDLLVLDDLGSEKPTEWSLQIMQMIINDRYEGLLPTIITSNLGLKALSEQLDDRIASRIYEMSNLVSFGNEDHRLKKGK